MFFFNVDLYYVFRPNLYCTRYLKTACPFTYVIGLTVVYSSVLDQTTEEIGPRKINYETWYHMLRDICRQVSNFCNYK